MDVALEVVVAGRQAAGLDDFRGELAGSSDRGYFLRIDYGHGHPVTETGAMLVLSPGATWLLSLDRDQPGNIGLVV